jgi:hypothetical protein
MGSPLNRPEYPWWVKLSLWQLPNRAAVWAFVWLSLAVAMILTAYLLYVGDSRWPVGLLFLLAAIPYWLSIRWVDRNGSWTPHK